MYIINVKWHYDSAHFLKSYNGKCENLHGHRYVVELALATDQLDQSGLAFDFVDIKKHLRELTEYLDHQNLNDLFPFTEIEPSAENQAKYIYDTMKERLPDRMKAALLYAKVWETPTQFALYTERASIL